MNKSPFDRVYLVAWSLAYAAVASHKAALRVGRFFWLNLTYDYFRRHRDTPCTTFVLVGTEVSMDTWSKLHTALPDVHACYRPYTRWYWLSESTTGQCDNVFLAQRTLAYS